MSKEHLSIGKLAKKSGTSSRRLRHFEKFGLLKPSRQGKRRFYNADDPNNVAVIKVYQTLGFSLKKVQELEKKLASKDLDAALKIAISQAAKVDLEMEKLQKQQFLLKRLRSKLSAGQMPHSAHCFLCGTNDGSRNWWGAMLDLFCQPCIEQLYSKISNANGDLHTRCTACGCLSKSPTILGTDGSICHDCLQEYVGCIQRAKVG